MPFGLDDVLFLVASTTALLWVKKNDLLHHVVYTSVYAATDDPKVAEHSARKAVSNTTNSTFLLRGFNLDEEFKRELGRSRATAAVEPIAVAGEADPNPLIRNSLVNAYYEDEIPVHEVPCVPHRHYNLKRRKPPASLLATYTEKEVTAAVVQYSPLEIQSVFVTMEQKQLWEAAVKVTRGISKLPKSFVYLSQINIEAALRTLLASGKGQLAVSYYFAFGVDILPCDDIVLALFNACRHDDRASLQLVDQLKLFQSSWSVTVYACCLTATSNYRPAETLELYEQYKSTVMYPETSKLKKFFVSTGPKEGAKLQYLYHIVIPLVLETFPDRADTLVQDMMHNDPGAAPDVYLRCLCLKPGRALARNYLANLFPDDTSITDENVPRMIELLYPLKPTAMNLNSVVKLLTSGSPEVPPCVKEWGSHTPLLKAWFRNVSLAHTADVHIIARTIAESDASSRLAELFLTAMMERKEFSVVPMLAMRVAENNKWALIAKSMSVYLSNQRANIKAKEVDLCVEASIHCGKWSSALFWVERAHAKQITLSHQTYEKALSCSKYCLWEESLRVVTSMSSPSKTCTAKGISYIVDAAARQGTVPSVVSALCKAKVVKWKL
ncbi:hypothetical protein AGDE_05556 [Angomonas deanei]|nr:hypothetical protein AGDE_05556 [Angomonas deanei]|eukprot:EPY38373.1 hypothetical protein AGDE_05556 [Angomonas deanei]